MIGRPTIFSKRSVLRAANARAQGPRGWGFAAFSLLEVLVALAIFALMAVVLGSAYVNVLNSYAAAARDRDADEDAAFACQQLLTEADVEKARQGDQFDSADGRHVVWSATIDPTTTADLFTVAFTCEVSTPGKSENKKLARSFTLLRPTWSDPSERDKLLQEAKDRIAEIQSKTANGFAPAAQAAGPAGPGGIRTGGGNRGNGGPPGGGPRMPGGGAVRPGPARNDGTVVAPPANGGKTGTGNNGNKGTGNPRTQNPNVRPAPR